MIAHRTLVTRLETNMQRITITIDDELIDDIEQVIASHGYQNMSEAIRDLIRAGLPKDIPEAVGAAHCAAALVYVYEQRTRQLPKRLQNIIHGHHDLTVATTRVPLDHDTCIEVALLKGVAKEVKHLGEHVIAERGVRYGQLVVVPAKLEKERHSHGNRRPHMHQHLHVR